jgi:acyl-CoA thioester hydrolase
MEPSAGAFEGRAHRLAVRVYYEDTDFTGLVYHASYLRFLERGRSDFLRLAGADHVAMGGLDTAFAVVRMEIDFRRAARIDDALLVVTEIAFARGPRIRFVQRIERAGELVCEARVDAACIDGSGRARRPPPELVAALAPYSSGERQA